MEALAGWGDFYVIVGSSAGALIGLQFVVITLIADVPIAQGQAQAGSAFATPTIVHFGAVLLLSGILSAPWHEVACAAALWALLGISGIVYEIVVARRMRVPDRIHARVRGLVISCSAAVRRIRNAGGVCIRDSLDCRRSVVRCGSGGAVAALRRHS